MKVKYAILATILEGIWDSSTAASHLSKFHGLRAVKKKNCKCIFINCNLYSVDLVCLMCSDVSILRSCQPARAPKAWRTAFEVSFPLDHISYAVDYVYTSPHA